MLFPKLRKLSENFGRATKNRTNDQNLFFYLNHWFEMSSNRLN